MGRGADVRMGKAATQPAVALNVMHSTVRSIGYQPNTRDVIMRKQGANS